LKEAHLSKIIGLYNWEQSKEWQDILLIIKIRNIIAHNGGYYYEDDGKYRKLIENNLIEVKESRELLLHQEMNKFTYEVLSKFWHDIKNEFRSNVKKIIING